MSAPPPVLVFTEDCLSASHGTGALLLRYFEGYPLDRLANVFLRRRDAPAWPRSFEAPRRPLPATSFRWPVGLATRAWNAAATRVPGRLLPVVERPPAFLPVGPALAAMGFAPAVVLASAFSVSGLTLVGRLGIDLPGVPIVQQFFDYFGSTPVGFTAALRQAAGRCARLWAVTEAIAADVRVRTGRPVEVVPSLHLRLPPAGGRDPVAGPVFRAVTIGNFQHPAMLEAVARIWADCRRRVPGLGPIEWLAHPESYRGLAAHLTPDVRWAGFHQGAAFLDRLAQADLCVVPGNLGDRARDDFARYSLPTRITEPLAVGVPVIALCSRDTALSAYLSTHRIGLATPLGPRDRTLPPLLDLIRDPARRAELGRRGRAHAAARFDLEPHRRRLLGELSRLAGEAAP